MREAADVGRRPGRGSVRRAEAAGVFFMEAMWTRCVPAILRMVEMVRDGVIGEPRLVTADFSVAFDSGPEHRVRNPALGGGALLDLGVYPLAISRLVLGEPAVVRAAATLTPEGVDETTAVTLVHPGGGVSALTCSISADGAWSATVSGTRAGSSSAGASPRPTGFSSPAATTSSNDREAVPGRRHGARGHRGAALPARRAAGEPARAVVGDAGGDADDGRGPGPDRGGYP